MKMHLIKCILAFLFIGISVSYAQTVDTIIVVNGGDTGSTGGGSYSAPSGGYTGGGSAPPA